MKNNFFLILLIGISTITCFCWHSKPTFKNNYYHSVWHYALRDSFIIKFEIDSIFHPVDPKIRWDDSQTSYCYEYKKSIICINYYALSKYDSVFSFDNVLKSQRYNTKDAHPERTIRNSNRINIGILDGIATSSYDSKVNEIIYKGFNKELQVVFDISIEVRDSINDSEAILKDLLTSLKFDKKSG